MAWKPPPIQGSDYIDPVDSDAHQRRLANGGRSAFDLGKLTTLNAPTMGVATVSLTWNGNTQNHSYTEASHGKVSPDNTTRTLYELGTGGVDVRWTLNHPERVTGVELAVFTRNNAVPIWSSNTPYTAGNCPANGLTSLEAIPNQPFTLTLQDAPYKIRVTVAYRNTMRRSPAARWVYLDVKPQCWVEVKLRNVQADAGVDSALIKLVPPDGNALTGNAIKADNEGKVSHKAYQPDGNYKITEVVHPDDDNAWELVAVESTD